MAGTDSSEAPLVGVVMGSRSDWETMRHVTETLEALEIPHEVRVVSAHRTPDLLMSYAMSKKRPDGLMWTQFGNSQYFMPGQLLLIVSYAAVKTGDARYAAFFDELLAVYGGALDGQMALAPPLWVPWRRSISNQRPSRTSRTQ